MSEYKGIPTTYKSRIYRSRLEARWARMFDLLGWDSEYEPYDLNGWIPDFLLFDRIREREILVEVKPHVFLKDFDTEKILSALRGSDRWGTDVLLVGASLIEADESENLGPGWLGVLVEGSYSFEPRKFGPSDYQDAMKRLWAESANTVQWNRVEPERPVISPRRPPRKQF